MEKLRLIKRLMDRGHRPGKIVGAALGELRVLGAESANDTPPSADLDAFLNLLRSHQTELLRAHLSQTLARSGLQTFIRDTVAPLTTIVGDAWMGGASQFSKNTSIRN